MHYKDITIFEVNKRINFLIQSKKDITEYFENLSEGFALDVTENKVARKKRQEINFYLKKLISYVRFADVNTSIYYSPPPVTGGPAGNIDIISNIFNLHSFQLKQESLVDMIDQALGIYDEEKTSAFIRTFNPFWWAWKLLKWIANIPFVLLQEVGFNTSKIENNFFGKLLKLIFELITFLAALFAVLKAMGYEENFVSLIKKIIKLP